jgi:hypothetical protein
MVLLITELWRKIKGKNISGIEVWSPFCERKAKWKSGYPEDFGRITKLSTTSVFGIILLHAVNIKILGLH